MRASVRNPPEARARDLGADGGLGVEVEVLEGLAGGEPGGADPQLGAGGVAGGDLAFEDGGEVVLVGPAGVAGLVGQPGGGLGDPRRLQRGGEVVDLLDRLGRRRLAAITRPPRSLIESERPVVVGQIPDQVLAAAADGSGLLELLPQHRRGLRRGPGR